MKCVKGDNLVKIHLRLEPLIQNVALVLENICVKFDENSFNIMEAMAMSVFFQSPLREVILSKCIIELCPLVRM